MSTTDDLIPILKKLRLSGLLETLALRLQQVEADNLGAEDFLYRLVHDEVERRDAKQLSLRLNRASFEHGKSLEDFDFTFNPKVPKSRLVELAAGSIIDRRENVLLLGPCGVGKSHIAQALGHRAVRRGHTVYFTTATQLFAQLRAGRGDQSYDRRLLRYTTPDLLIVDDVGLRPLGPPEAEDLYDLVRSRYERASTIFTPNRDITECHRSLGTR